VSVITTLLCCDAFSSSSVVSCSFSVLCVYLTFRHHPHPLGYLGAKLRFFCGLRCCASPWRKIAYSITHSRSLFDAGASENENSRLNHRLQQSPRFCCSQGLHRRDNNRNGTTATIITYDLYILFSFSGAVVDTARQMLYQTDTFSDLDLLILGQLCHWPTNVWTRMIEWHSYLHITSAIIRQNPNECKCNNETTMNLPPILHTGLALCIAKICA